MINFLKKIKNFFITPHLLSIIRSAQGITDTQRRAEISQTRDTEPSKNRDIISAESLIAPAASPKSFLFCPYCASEDFVKRGTRRKKREKVQLYLCRSCRRTFTPFSTKGKHYPMEWILESLSYYNLGFSLEQTCRIIKEKSGNLEIQPSTLNNWTREFSKFCAYDRMRPFGMKLFPPSEIVETATLAHRQLYRFRFHRAKIRLIIKEDFKHYYFTPLREFLELVSAECPHQYFQEGLRASEAPLRFSKTEMIVRSKHNYATRLAEFVLQAVKENKKRHEALQRFMLANDSVTVATEVPVYIRKEDLEHMQTQLGFQLYRPAPEHPAPEVAPVFDGKSQEGQGDGLSEDKAMSAAGRLILHNMLPCALGIPHLIAEAHSLRFGDHSNSVVALEKVMLNCNKMMVYLEQARDICETGLAWEIFDEQIKKYTYLRRKVLNLQRSWKKFDSQKS